jgi:DNA mismatch repair protein MutS
VGESSVTPMMAQYLEIKAQHRDALLFYRMGDFYELFFEDAGAAAAALGIALTHRGLHRGQPIPMCGVPVVAAEGYLLTLIRKGFRVAVAEQVEDPAEARKRGSKAVVARAVVRVVTPGTLSEEALLEARAANYLAAWAEVRGEGALAWGDMSTGELWVAAVLPAAAGMLVARVAPRELLVVEGSEGEPVAAGALAQGAAVTARPRAVFDSAAGERRLQAAYGVAALDAFGAFSRVEVAALGALVEYLALTQRGVQPRLAPPQRERAGMAVAIDEGTRRNLELTQGAGGGRAGSLLDYVDRSVTAAGARLLARRIAAPLCDPVAISARLDAVGWMLAEAERRVAVRAALREVPDLDRALGRLSLGRGGPRDLAALRDGLAVAGRIGDLLAGAPEVLAEAAAALAGHGELQARLAAALAAAVPVALQDGGVIAAGFDAALDAARALRDEARGVIAGLQAEYVAQTGIGSLKVRHNGVLGYFVETTDVHAGRMLVPPLSAVFRHRQTTANLLRFSTAELADLEARILGAGAEAQAIEAAHVADLTAAVLAAAGPVAAAARALAEVDVAAGLADVAADGGWCRPVVEAGSAFVVRAGRHPVVEAALRRAGGEGFVANDCVLTAGGVPAIWLVTGPNMGGKSTFLRQNALIAVLAQAGSFVPAAEARIGVVTQLFSRVGAADDLARGRSTFMVEMVETAAILNQAGEGAFVILDEIGRGTATWDGLSIAWAVLEHLQAVNRCRALFATHYHELTALAGRLPGVENATLRVAEWEGSVVFLHEVRAGAADRSYGVQVARLAGLPTAVVARARAVLARLEAGERAGGAAAGRAAALVEDLPLFRAAGGEAVAEAVRESAVEVALRGVEPDALSPREALDFVYRLKALLAGG